MGRLLRRELSIEEFVAANSYPLSKAIVKEPNLTFVAEELLNHFSSSKAVFIVRDPRTNIKSLLARLSLPGDLDALSLGDTWLPNRTWRSILEGRDLECRYTHYIDVLAHRWNVATTVYLKHPQKYILLRYEEFLQNKVSSVHSLAHSLEYPVIGDITPYVDVQYQGASDKSTSIQVFFGERNLSRITAICSEYMDRLEYR